MSVKGAAGTVMANGNTSVSGIAAGISSQTAAVAVNTTVAEWLTLTVTPGGTAPVVTIANADIEIVKP